LAQSLPPSRQGLEKSQLQQSRFLEARRASRAMLDEVSSRTLRGIFQSSGIAILAVMLSFDLRRVYFWTPKSSRIPHENST
jgi:hypothetical protein